MTNLTFVAHTPSGIQGWSAFVARPLRIISQVCVTAHEPYRSAIGRGSPPQGFTTVSFHTIPFVVWLKICLRKTPKMLYNCIGLDSLDFLEMSISCTRTRHQTSEGVLIRPDVQQLKYHVASPLIDGLIRMRVIPSLFRNAPVVPIPDVRTNVPDILFIFDGVSQMLR